MEVLQCAKGNTYFPIENWQQSTPEQQGVDSTLLTEALNYINDNFKNYCSFVVVKNGYLIYEANNQQPYEDHLSKVFKASLLGLTKLLRKPNATLKDKYSDLFNMRSATKSIISILVGIAIDKGFIKSVDESAFNYLPLHGNLVIDENMKKITIKHLLTMKSGIPSIEGGLNGLKMLLGNGDWVNYILKLRLEAEPGEKFVYNSANTHLLSAILTNATNMSTFDFAKKYLFEPLNIKNVFWEKDKRGYNFGGGNLFLSQYDLARIGFLYLNKGIWDKNVIVSEWWVEQSLTSYYEWCYGFHYGYLWYLKNEKCVKSGKEYMTYSASGAGGQKIFIIPDLDIVIAVTSRSSLIKDGSYILNDIIGKYILQSVK